MRKIKVVVLLVQQLQHGFTKNAKVSPNLTVAHIACNRCIIICQHNIIAYSRPTSMIILKYSFAQHNNQ